MQKLTLGAAALAVSAVIGSSAGHAMFTVQGFLDQPAAALNPDLPLILMSGFSPVDLYERGLSLSHGHLITKPFDPTALLSLVQQLLPK